MKKLFLVIAFVCFSSAQYQEWHSERLKYENERQVQQMAREVGTHMPARAVPHDWWWGNGNRAHGPMPRIAAWTLVREDADEALCIEHWCTVIVASEQISYNEPSSYWYYKRNLKSSSEPHR